MTHRAMHTAGLSTLVALQLAAVGCGGSALPAGAGDTGTAFAPGKARFSAAFFVEAYCSGCHQPGYAAPSGRQVSLFSTDPWWQQPFRNPNWFEALDYGVVVRRGDAIRCGVHPSPLPDGCTLLASVPPGFFTKAEKFPPPGTPSAGYGQTPPPMCAYAADGHSCPQPSNYEREQMVAWIDAGFPR